MRVRADGEIDLGPRDVKKARGISFRESASLRRVDDVVRGARDTVYERDGRA
jgi:hypothetical protein